MPETPDAEAGAITSRDVAKGFGTTLAARLGGVLEVITQPLYVWLFGLAGYGLYATLWAAINLIENIADLGMTSAMQRVVPQAKSEGEAVAALRASMLLGVGPCLMVAAVVSMFAPDLTHIFNAAEKDQAHLAQAIRLFVWALPLWAFVEIATSALRAKRVFGAEIRLRLFWEQAIRAVLVVALFAGGVETMALFYAHLASLAIICGLSIRLLARYFDLALLFRPQKDSHIFQETWKAGLAVLPSNMVARLFGDGPPIVLNAWLPGGAGAVAAGLYAIARKVSSLVQLVRTAFAYVLAPLASAASTGHKDEVREIYSFATRVQLALALPLGATLIGAGPAILRLFGKDAAIAFPALAILVAARIIEAITGAAAPIQQVTRGYWSQIVGSSLGFAIAAVIALAVMPKGGLAGMSAAVAVGLVVAGAMPVIQLWVKARLHPFERPFVRTFGVSALTAGAGFGLTSLALGLPVWAEGPLLVLILLAAIWLSCRYALPRRDREALGKTGRKLRLAP